MLKRGFPSRTGERKKIPADAHFIPKGRARRRSGTGGDGGAADGGSGRGSPGLPCRGELRPLLRAQPRHLPRNAERCPLPSSSLPSLTEADEPCPPSRRPLSPGAHRPGPAPAAQRPAPAGAAALRAGPPRRSPSPRRRRPAAAPR